MASFLPQIIDELWQADTRKQRSLWLSMEPTSGGRGAWPELERVNDVARRTLTASGAAVFVDLYSMALPRPDMLTDGSHYNHHYRRAAARLLLAIACDTCPHEGDASYLGASS